MQLRLVDFQLGIEVNGSDKSYNVRSIGDDLAGERNSETRRCIKWTRKREQLDYRNEMSELMFLHWFLLRFISRDFTSCLQFIIPPALESISVSQSIFYIDGIIAIGLVDRFHPICLLARLPRKIFC